MTIRQGKSVYTTPVDSGKEKRKGGPIQLWFRDESYLASRRSPCPLEYVSTSKCGGEKSQKMNAHAQKRETGVSGEIQPIGEPSYSLFKR